MFLNAYGNPPTPTIAAGTFAGSSALGQAGWSAKLHSANSTAGAGNILLGDGSGQQTSSTAYDKYLNTAQDTGNFVNGQTTYTTTNNARYLFP